MAWSRSQAGEAQCSGGSGRWPARSILPYWCSGGLCAGLSHSLVHVAPGRNDLLCTQPEDESPMQHAQGKGWEVAQLP